MEKGLKFVVGCIFFGCMNIIVMVCVNVVGEKMFLFLIVKGKIFRFLFGFNIIVVFFGIKWYY